MLKKTWKERALSVMLALTMAIAPLSGPAGSGLWLTAYAQEGETEGTPQDAASDSSPQETAEDPSQAAQAEAAAKEAAKQEDREAAQAEEEAARAAKEEADQAALEEAQAQHQAEETASGEETGGDAQADPADPAAQMSPQTDDAPSEGQEAAAPEESSAPAETNLQPEEGADVPETQELSGDTPPEDPQTEEGTGQSEEESEEPKEERTKRVYTYTAGDLQVTATLSDPAAVPDDARFVVTHVTPQSAAYNYEAYMEALNLQSSDTVYDSDNTMLYDVAFLVDGDEDSQHLVEFEPEVGSVHLRFAFLGGQVDEMTPEGEDAQVEVLHLPLREDVRDAVDSTAEAVHITKQDVCVEQVSAQQADLPEGIVSFTTDSFSVYSLSYTSTEESEQVGRLEGADYHIYVDDDELPDGERIEVTGGENFNLTFSWTMPNNQKVNITRQGEAHYASFGLDVPLRNLVIHVPEEGLSGELFQDGVQIGTYEMTISEDGQTLHYEAVLNDDGLTRSDTHGNAVLNASLQMSEDKSERDGEEKEIQFGDQTNPVTIKNPGEVSLKKTASSTVLYDSDEEQSYVEYTLTVNYREIMSEVTLSDTPQADVLRIAPDSVEVMLDKEDITASCNVTGTSQGGFTLSLPESTGKAQKHTAVVTYRAYFTVAANELLSRKEAKNDALLHYTDDQGEPQELEDTTTVKLTGPSVKKKGAALTDSDGKLLRKSASGSLYFPVLYTVEIAPGAFESYLAEGDYTLTDALTVEGKGQAWEISAYGFALANNSTTYFAGNYMDESGTTKSLTATDFYLEGKRAFADDAALLQALKNGACLLGQGSALSGLLSNGNAAPALTRDERTGNYFLTYAVLVAAKDNTGFLLDAHNQITLQVGGAEPSAEADVKGRVQPSVILVKGPDGQIDTNPSYNENTSTPFTTSAATRGAYSSSYEADINDQGKTTVDYMTGVNFKNLREMQNWNAIAQTIAQIKLQDQAQSGIQSIDESSGVVLLWSNDNLTVQFAAWDAFVKARDALYEEGTANGWYGTGDNDQTLVALYQEQMAAGSALASAGLMGVAAVTPTVLGNRIEATLAIGSGNGISCKALEGYNPAGGVQTISSSSSVSFMSLVDRKGSVTLAYRANTAVDLSVSKSNAVNYAHVEFSDGGDDTNPPIKPATIQTVYSTTPQNPQEEPGTVTLGKSHPTNGVTVDGAALTYDTDTSLGWLVYANAGNAAATQSGEEIVLIDTIPEGLAADLDSLKAFYGISSSTSGTALSSEYYSARVEDSTLTITIPYTTALEELFEALKSNAANHYLSFYFKTDVDPAFYLESTAADLRFYNKAEGTYGNQPLNTSTVSAKLTRKELLNKETMNADLTKASTQPVWEDGGYVGNYRIEVNLPGLDLTAEKTVDLVDTMTEVMALDESSLRVLNTEGEEVPHSFTYEDHVLTVTIPDDQHLFVQYKVRFEMDLTDLAAWADESNTVNRAQLKAKEKTIGTVQEVSFETFQVQANSAAETITGSLGIQKVDAEDPTHTLKGARFTLRSVYDSNGETYGDDQYDDVYQAYQNVTASDGTYTFENLPLDRIYELTEVSAPAGYEAGAPLYIALTGADYEKDQSYLVAYEEASGHTVILCKSGEVTKVTNAPERIDVTAVKAWLGLGGSAAAPTGGEATFALLADGSETGKTVTLDGAVDETGEDTPWTAVFQDLPKYSFGDGDTPKEITYTVKETDSSAGYAPAEGKDEAAAGGTITNRYAAEGSYTFAGTKQIDTRVMTEADIFTFTVTELVDGKPSDNVWKVQNDVTGKIDYPELTFRADPQESDIGLHTYEIKEEQTDITGITVDSQCYTVILDVSDLGDGTLDVVPARESADPQSLSFTNAYEASGTFTLGGTKTIDTRALTEDDVFTFTVTEILQNGETGDSWTATNNAKGEIAYPTLSFALNAATDDTGVHTYEIKEEQTNLAGVRASAQVYQVILKVSDQGDGTLLVEADKDSDDPAKLDFVNAYEAEGDYTFAGTKQIDTRALTEDDVFTFTVTELVDGKPSDHVWTVNNDATGKIAYPTLSFALNAATDDTGVHTYEIKEEQTDLAGVRASAQVYQVVLKVSDQGDGTLSVEADKDSDDPAKLDFVNAYEAAGAITFRGTKGIDRRDLQEGDIFEFSIVEDGEEIGVGTSDLSGTITYPEISYVLNADQDDTGDHIYLITEKPTSVAGISADTRSYLVVLTVRDQGDGTLQVTPSEGSDDPEALDFVNAYEATGGITFAGTKTIDKRPLTSSDVFTFLIQENGKEIASARSDAKGVIAYPELSYVLNEKQDDTGVHTYTITEQETTLGGITIDDRSYTVSVTVSDKGDGTLDVQADESSDDPAKLDFVNTYTTSGSVTFGGTKTLEGRTLKDGEFTFELVEDGEVIATAVNGKDGSYAFDPITYSEADLSVDADGMLAPATRTYLIREQAGEDEDITYDDTEYTITATLTDDGKGNIIVTTDQEPDAAAFVNTYEEEGLDDMNGGGGSGEKDKNKTTEGQKQSAETEQVSEGVRTGDDTPILPYVVMLLAAACCSIGIIWQRRRRRA